MTPKQQNRGLPSDHEVSTGNKFQFCCPSAADFTPPRSCTRCRRRAHRARNEFCANSVRRRARACLCGRKPASRRGSNQTVWMPIDKARRGDRRLQATQCSRPRLVSGHTSRWSSPCQRATATPVVLWPLVRPAQPNGASSRCGDLRYDERGRAAASSAQNRQSL